MSRFRSRWWLVTGASVSALSLPAWAENQGANAEPRPVPTTELRTLTLKSAIETALRLQPSLRQARSATDAARGRVVQARSGYLPQILGTAEYQRTTGNFVPRPGFLPRNVGFSTRPSLSTFDYYTFNLTATQLIYDFGQTTGKWSAAEASVEAQRATEKATELQVRLNVLTAFSQARAARAMVRVAEDTLTDQQRHLLQIQGFVKAGTNPEIDLAQGLANVANAQVQLINAKNTYSIAKSQLNQAMGIIGDTRYEVADETLREVPGENQSLDALVTRAFTARPELVSLDKQREAQRRTVRSLQGAYWPSLAATAGVSEAGTSLTGLVYNGYVGATLTWPFLQGGLTRGQVAEARATLAGLDAQEATQRLQIRVQVEQAQLAIEAAKASIAAAENALKNAREQRRLAEGRYAAGVGNIIELSDAQVGLTSASAQLVQADYNLSTARAQLLAALGAA